VVDGVEAVGTLVARFDATTFEATTAIALDHFAREAVDVAVLEVGLGGRLDAHDVRRAPDVAVIARVDLDHQAVLGATLEAIAAEKAAIIRGGRRGLGPRRLGRPSASSWRAPPRSRSALARGPRRPVGLGGATGPRRPASGPAPAGRDGPWPGSSLPCPGSFQPSNALLAVSRRRASSSRRRRRDSRRARAGMVAGTLSGPASRAAASWCWTARTIRPAPAPSRSRCATSSARPASPFVLGVLRRQGRRRDRRRGSLPTGGSVRPGRAR